MVWLFIHQYPNPGYKVIKITTEKGNDKDSQDYIKELNSGSCKSVWDLCDCKSDKHINAGPDSPTFNGGY